MTDDQYKIATNELNGRLYVPYQRSGVQWLLKQENIASGPRGGFLCDEMGLGKTIQLIATMLGNKKQKTLLVVPKSIIIQWAAEIKRFAPAIGVHIFEGPKRALTSAQESWMLNPERPSVVIASYNVLGRKNGKPGMTTAIHYLKWDRIILDEAHEIRNKQSKVFKNVCLLRAEIKWIVTGTPVFNSIRDFQSLCKFLGTDDKVDCVHEMYVLRRTKEDLADDNERLRLPPCNFENVEIEMYEEEKSLYRLAYVEASEVMKQTNVVGSKNMEIIEHLLRMRQCMIWPQVYLNNVAKKNGTDPERWTSRSKKMETLFRLIDEHPREKSLVFCQHVAEMDYIQGELCESYDGYDSDDLMGCGLNPDPDAVERKSKRTAVATRSVFRIDGSVSKEDRDRLVGEFRNSPPGSIFLLQIKTGGVGLNLQEATRVYITTPSWNPATELQALGRSHRTGQTQCVHVKKLIYKGFPGFASVEEAIVMLQANKSDVCATVLKDPRIRTQIPVGRRVNKISLMKNIFDA